MSIIDVAKAAGLSHSTVSRVINGRPGVAPETVEAVRAAMRQVGYRPSARRPGPRPNGTTNAATGNVGLLMVGTDAMFARAPVTAAVLHAVEQSLASHGFNLIVGQVDDSGRLPPNVANGNIDGLLLHGYAPTEYVRRRLSGHPSVWLLSQRSRSGYWGDRVCPDNEQIGRLAAEHLAGRGYRDLAYLYFAARHRGFQQRAEAFAERGEELGARVTVLPGRESQATTDVMQHRGGREFEDGETERLVARLVELSPRPEAVFVPRDRLTVKVYRALRRHGIEPGRDISVMSCDNEPVIEAIDPCPTTIDVRPDVIGREAVEQLRRRMADRVEGVRTTITVEPQLVISADDSPAAARSSGPRAGSGISPGGEPGSGIAHFGSAAFGPSSDSFVQVGSHGGPPSVVVGR